ncbi:MAG: glycoside hydrolase family protein [Syntrophales bacterium]|nr:glycoside hydrolase family protein [Syntrophales bacterium]
MPDKNYRVTAKGGLNIRLGPGVNHKDVGNLAYGELVRSPEMEGPVPDGWLPILLYVSREHLEGVGEEPEEVREESSPQVPPPTPGKMRTSRRGLEFIKNEEGCVLHVYRDPAGYPTIGVGHLIKPGEAFDTITEEEALQLLARDLAVAENAVNQMVRVPLTQNQFEALVSFVFNVGSGNFQKSTLLKLLNQGRYDAVPGELAKWRKAGGQVLPGLVARRRREAELWGEGQGTSQAPPAEGMVGQTRAGKWKGIVGLAFTPESFREYVQGLTWDDWVPEFIVLHNTEDPNLAMRPNGFALQHILDLQAYYRDDCGWSAGPHLFVDDKQIWIFTPLTIPGVHANSWNSRTLGVEMLGDYRMEPFDEGRGSKVKANAVAAVAILSEALGLDPETVMLHRENGETEHYCPGDHVDKQEFIRLVQEYGV